MRFVQHWEGETLGRVQRVLVVALRAGRLNSACGIWGDLATLHRGPDFSFAGNGRPEWRWVGGRFRAKHKSLIRETKQKTHPVNYLSFIKEEVFPLLFENSHPIQ